MSQSSMSRGLCPRRSLSREGVSVQGGGLCPGRGSLSREGVSVQGRDLCPGLSVYRVSVGRRSLSRRLLYSGRDLCPEGPMSQRSLSRGAYVSEVSVQGSLSSWVSIQGRGLCPGRGSLSKGSLSREGVSVQGGLCPGTVSVQEVSVQGVSVRGSLSRGGGLCPGGLCPVGSLSNGVIVREVPCIGTRGRYASYWNSFLCH